MKPFLAVLHARNMEFLRDRAALTWNLMFPFLLVLGLAFIFSGDKDLYKVGVLGQSPSTEARIPFLDSRYIQFVDQQDPDFAVDKVRHHQFDMFLDTAGRRYWINTSSPNGYVLERMLWGSGGGDYVKQEVDGEEVRYVDWVVPGVLALNIMFSCLFGVGYVIVRYRKNGFLKRLRATPLSAFQFLWAQLMSRLLLILTVTVVVYIGCDLLLDFHMAGSYWALFFLATVGAMCMIALGLLLASRLASEELAGGLLNLLTWPMMLLSGVWFSLEGTHPWVQTLAQALPLTHVVDGAHMIMTEGAGFAEVSGEFGILLGMTGVFLALGSLMFRWE